MLSCVFFQAANFSDQIGQKNVAQKTENS